MGSFEGEKRSVKYRRDVNVELYFFFTFTDHQKWTSYRIINHWSILYTK